MGTEKATRALPQRFDAFVAFKEIWRGTRSTVYLARDSRDEALVALKVLYPTGDCDLATQREAAKLEAGRLRDIVHPNIIELRKHGEWNGVPYLSFPYIEGHSLDQTPRATPETTSALLAAMCKVCRAVHHAHTKGVIHRDLKPKNILLDTRGEPYVLDWGLSWRKSEVTKSGYQHIVGTPAYMSPEQARGEEKALTPATDIYSLGAILYHLMTGDPPFQADTSWKTLQMAMSMPAPPPSALRSSLDLRLERVILLCLDKEPERRYETAKALADDLERVCRDGEPKGRGTALRRLLKG